MNETLRAAQMFGAFASFGVSAKWVAEQLDFMTALNALHRACLLVGADVTEQDRLATEEAFSGGKSLRQAFADRVTLLLNSGAVARG